MAAIHPQSQLLIVAIVSTHFFKKWSIQATFTTITCVEKFVVARCRKLLLFDYKMILKAIRRGSACHRPHKDSVYLGNEQKRFVWPRLVKHAVGFPTHSERWKTQISHGLLIRYTKLRVAHAPGMPGTFSLPLISKETTNTRSWHASRHVRDARAVMHVGIANLWWQRKRSRHSRRMRNPQFYVSGKRPNGHCSHECWFQQNQWRIIVSVL